MLPTFVTLFVVFCWVNQCFNRSAARFCVLVLALDLVRTEQQCLFYTFRPGQACWLTKYFESIKTKLRYLDSILNWIKLMWVWTVDDWRQVDDEDDMFGWGSHISALPLQKDQNWPFKSINLILGPEFILFLQCWEVLVSWMIRMTFCLEFFSFHSSESIAWWEWWAFVLVFISDSG